MKSARVSKTLLRKKIDKTLHEQFGYEELRSLQSSVIEAVLQKKSTIAIMPTGAGKSLCYQLPSTMLEGVTLVVSPLIALMKDQKEKSDEFDIKAAELNSSISTDDQKSNLAAVKKGRAEILFVTPERLAKPDFLKSLKKTEVSLLVVDEAHCVSQWGHDFRPAYSEIASAWNALGKPPVLALTATAKQDVIDDMKSLLGPSKFETFDAGVLRENLRFEAQVHDKEGDREEALLEFLGSSNGSGIVYSATVKEVDRLYELLVANGVKAAKYHGRMKSADRAEQQDLFMSGERPVIVATNAFGLGIDKPDLRFVAHYHLPGSLEAYYQEAGRAGRDGLPSRCLLLYLKKDNSTQSFFISHKRGTDEEARKRKDHDREKLRSMIQYAQSALCRWKTLLKYFEQPVDWECCGHCDNCDREAAHLVEAPHVQVASSEAVTAAV